MRIRLLRPWNGMREGTVIAPGDGVADLLIKRGVAESCGPTDNKSFATPQHRKAVRKKVVCE